MGYAAILGLRADLNLVGQDYSWASSLFYFGYLTASGFVAILLVRLPIGRFMAIAMYVSSVHDPKISSNISTHLFVTVRTVALNPKLIRSKRT